MSEANEVYLVLKPGVTRADFASAAADAGLAFFQELPGDGNREAYQQMWGWPNLEHPTAGVYYLESPLYGFPYVVVQGSELPLLAGKLTNRLAVYTRAELIDDAMNATEHNEKVHAINRLALVFVECEPAVLAIITNYILAGATPLLREAAVNAVGFRAWPQFRPLLEALAEQEKEANVRERAAAVLAAWPAQ
jgi:hypothetical protein